MHLRWLDGEASLEDGSVEDALAGLGIVSGHRVALVAGNSPLHIVMHKSAARRGWALVPLAAGQPWPLLQNAIRALRCDALVCTADQASFAPALGLPFVVASPEGRSLRVVPGPILGPRGDPGLAFVLQTSGTSGTPRPVEVSRSMLASHRRAANLRLEDSGRSVWLCALGLDRVGAVAMADRAISNRATLVLEPRFDAKRTALILAGEGVTHLSLVPTMLRRLLAEWGPKPPPQDLRCLLLGGDSAPEALVQSALTLGWPLWCTYGMTEACSQVATATPQERRIRPGTSGRPLDGVSVSVVGGEVVVSGLTVAGGGPLATGDIGRLDAEGFLYLEGRMDDRITTGGDKVDPALVEACLAAHPAVAEACVVGLPDAEWGQRVVAAVVLRPGAMAPDLRAWCKDRLAAAQVPKEFRVVEALPRTATEKVQRATVRASFQATVPT